MTRVPYPAVLVLGAVWLNSCAPASFNTELSNAGSLAAGDPVTSLGATIGSVTSVSPLPDGNSGVAFDINHSDTRLVLQDSIMVLRNDHAASLELLNTNPISLRAAPGSTVEGAANDQEANLLVASRMPGFSAGLAAMAGAVAAMPPGAATAPAASTLQQQLNAVQNWYAANGARNTAAVAQQLQQINQSAAALERQLINQGRSPQAQQLRNQIDQLARALAGSTTPSAPPNTLVTPPVH
jgi:MlaD protein